MSENESVCWIKAGKGIFGMKSIVCQQVEVVPGVTSLRGVREGGVGSQGWIWRDLNVSAKSLRLISDFLLSPC